MKNIYIFYYFCRIYRQNKCKNCKYNKICSTTLYEGDKK